jgi:aquaporin Z
MGIPSKESRMRGTIRPLAAEFIGTFFFVFVGCAAVVLSGNPDIGLAGVAFAHAIALAVGVTFAMPISGGHLNPAVTFAVWMAGRIQGGRAAGYMVSQLAAAVAAALAVRQLYPIDVVTASGVGVPRLAPEMTLTSAIVLEALLTALLVSAVFGTAVSSHAPRVGGFAIGLTLLPAIVVAGPLTGAALNPARAFGPALVAGDWHMHLAYWIGPLLGAAVAALLWAKVLLPVAGDPEP